MLALNLIQNNLYKQKLVEKIFEKNSLIPIYILGRNENAEQLASIINVSAFIDDFTDEKFYLGKPIIQSSNIKKHSIAVSCSLAIYPHSAKKTLQRSDVQYVLDYLDVVKYAKHVNLKIKFVDRARKDLEQNFEKYKWVYSRIKEEESKKVFSNILNFRNSLELDYLKSYVVDEQGQYFEDFLELKGSEVFVDAGAYDGQTSIEFIKHCPKYKSIYIFEPSEDNLQLARINLNEFKSVIFISKGLSNQKDILKFDTSNGSASSISKNGTVKINVDTLDALVDEKVTFIKMDIEGSEGVALEGMKGHILNDHPKIAISVYHKADDFWKISEQVLNIRDDYDIYLRHYTEGTDETVMYFMPRKV